MKCVNCVWVKEQIINYQAKHVLCEWADTVSSVDTLIQVLILILVGNGEDERWVPKFSRVWHRGTHFLAGGVYVRYVFCWIVLWLKMFYITLSRLLAGAWDSTHSIRWWDSFKTQPSDSFSFLRFFLLFLGTAHHGITRRFSWHYKPTFMIINDGEQS